MRFHGFVVASVVASTIAARMGNGGVHVVIITTARLEYRNNMGDSGLVTVSNGGDAIQSVAWKRASASRSGQ